MTVENDTASWYRYMDMTPQAEALYEVITETIDEVLAAMEQAVKDGHNLI